MPINEQTAITPVSKIVRSSWAYVVGKHVIDRQNCSFNMCFPKIDDNGAEIGITDQNYKSKPTISSSFPNWVCYKAYGDIFNERWINISGGFK